MKDEFTIWLRVGDEFDLVGFNHHTPVMLEDPASCAPTRIPLLYSLKDAVGDERFKGSFLVHTGSGGWEYATFDRHKYIQGGFHIQTDTLLSDAIPSHSARRELVKVLNRALETDEIKHDFEQLGLSNLSVSAWLTE